MNWVSLDSLKRLRFFDEPINRKVLTHWCVIGELPARKMGIRWFVDLDAFDRGEKGDPARLLPKVPPRLQSLVKLSRAELQQLMAAQYAALDPEARALLDKHSPEIKAIAAERQQKGTGQYGTPTQAR